MGPGSVSVTSGLDATRSACPVQQKVTGPPERRGWLLTVEASLLQDRWNQTFGNGRWLNLSMERARKETLHADEAQRGHAQEMELEGRLEASAGGVLAAAAHLGLS